MADLNGAVRAIVEGRLDVADRTIDDVVPITADAEFENLRSRARTPAAVDLHAKTVQLRDRQGRVIEAAWQLLDAARSGTPFGERFEAFQRAAEDYNAQVDAVNEVLAAPRATSPGVTRKLVVLDLGEPGAEPAVALALPERRVADPEFDFVVLPPKAVAGGEGVVLVASPDQPSFYGGPDLLYLVDLDGPVRDLGVTGQHRPRHRHRRPRARRPDRRVRGDLAQRGLPGGDVRDRGGRRDRHAPDQPRGRAARGRRLDHPGPLVRPRGQAERGLRRLGVHGVRRQLDPGPAREPLAVGGRPVGAGGPGSLLASRPVGDDARVVVAGLDEYLRVGTLYVETGGRRTEVAAGVTAIAVAD
ncbi:hypothetical protein [Saccharothrix lopnurensis]|uniref:Uncharacterized protein n=1 Tax=Saccharothrix lopnurensis TaxID=1670621 RepID=A0ABW1PE06_9PSEU